MSKKPPKRPRLIDPSEFGVAILCLETATKAVIDRLNKLDDLVEEIDARTEHLTPQIRSESGPDGGVRCVKAPTQPDIAEEMVTKPAYRSKTSKLLHNIDQWIILQNGGTQSKRGRDLELECEKSIEAILAAFWGWYQPAQTSSGGWIGGSPAKPSKKKKRARKRLRD